MIIRDCTRIITRNSLQYPAPIFGLCWFSNCDFYLNPGRQKTGGGQML